MSSLAQLDALSNLDCLGMQYLVRILYRLLTSFLEQPKYLHIVELALPHFAQSKASRHMPNFIEFLFVLAPHSTPSICLALPHQSSPTLPMASRLSHQASNASLTPAQQSVSRQSSSGSLPEKRCRSSMVGESSGAAKRGRPAAASKPRGGGLTKVQNANAKAKAKAKARSQSRKSKATVSDDEGILDDNDMPELLDIEYSDDEKDGAELDTSGNCLWH
ncbi:hypothetical protein BDZ89DRAFT_1182947 [Hymenopellis radicata]|nr:hypothetical protein BDZ89DRAFT_1182947 [Hymenopellis radicata]